MIDYIQIGVLAGLVGVAAVIGYLIAKNMWKIVLGILGVAVFGIIFLGIAYHLDTAMNFPYIWNIFSGFGNLFPSWARIWTGLPMFGSGSNGFTIKLPIPALTQTTTIITISPNGTS